MGKLLYILVLLLLAVDSTTAGIAKNRRPPARGPQQALDFGVACYDNGHALTSVEQLGVNWYVWDSLYGKVNGNDTYNQCIAIYLMVGGSASTCMLNLVDPRDDDTAFRLTFVNSPTITDAGVDWNGTDQYANTHINPSVDIVVDDTHLAYFTDEDVATTGANELGAYDGAFFMIAVAESTISSSYIFNAGSLTGGTVPSPATEYFIGTRTSSSDHRMYHNEDQLGSTNANASGSQPNEDTYMAALSVFGTPTAYSSRRCQVATIGLGFTLSEIQDQLYAINRLNTFLGR